MRRKWLKINDCGCLTEIIDLKSVTSKIIDLFKGQCQ